MTRSQSKNTRFDVNDDRFVQSMIKAISPERLNAYCSTAESNTLDALKTKAWNIQLCASLYPALQIVEMGLRNSINQAMQAHFGQANWFTDPTILNKNELKIVTDSIHNLKQLHRLSDSSHLVSELPFGFWTNLLHTSYERKIWHPLIQQIFPYAPKKLRRRTLISQRFREIRHLRNRVFHHQRIWNLSDLPERKKTIHAAIYWIEPALIEFLNEIDTFDHIYEKGLVQSSQIVTLDQSV